MQEIVLWNKPDDPQNDADMFSWGNSHFSFPTRLCITVLKLGKYSAAVLCYKFAQAIESHTCPSTTQSEDCPRGKYRGPPIKNIKITKVLETVLVIPDPGLETSQDLILTKFVVTDSVLGPTPNP